MKKHKVNKVFWEKSENNKYNGTPSYTAKVKVKKGDSYIIIWIAQMGWISNTKVFHLHSNFDLNNIFSFESKDYGLGAVKLAKTRVENYFERHLKEKGELKTENLYRLKDSYVDLSRIVHIDHIGINKDSYILPPFLRFVFYLDSMDRVNGLCEISTEITNKESTENDNILLKDGSTIKYLTAKGNLGKYILNIEGSDNLNKNYGFKGGGEEFMKMYTDFTNAWGRIRS